MSGNMRRAIPEDYKYNPKKLKHLKSILHNVSVALGTLSSALNEFSKLKGPDISPDGMLGGVGYIIPIREIKQTLNNSVHGLSDLADCIADELTNPRWNAREDKEVKKLIKEKDKITDEVEEQIEEQEDINPNDIVTVSEKKAQDMSIRAAVRQSLINTVKTKES